MERKLFEHTRPSCSCSPVEREYTLSQINWKRSLTEIDMKRRRAAERERSRLQFDVIKQIANPTLKFELEQFRLFGKLKKTETEEHNTLPNTQTVSAERDYIEFEQKRKLQPHAVQYRDIYTSMKAEADKPRTPSSRTTSSLSISKREKSPFRYNLSNSLTPTSGLRYLSPHMR